MTELERVYRLYFKDVYLYVKSLSGDEKIAEDITSETFLKALRCIHSFKGTCDIRVWLCQIAKNSYFTYLRKNKREVNDEYLDTQVDYLNIDELVCDPEMCFQIHNIVHDLQEPYKEVFSLRVFAELSFKQIGQLFGKSENWACVTYHRARNKIREKVEGEL